MARSLGTLTIDVIANVGGFASGMDKAERASEKWRKQVEKDAERVGTALGVGIAAGVAALTAWTVATVNQANEIAKLSQIAGTGTTEFQRYSVGAEALGIQQDKLADIFKDTQDKVGDFLQNGGGPLQDFFKNIAPQIGVTAKQFQNLSGPQALQLYVDSLEKAQVSQGDMVFYMEAIASDATTLLPLLRDGGEGFREFGDAAAAAGAILGEDTVANAQKMKAEVWLVQQQLTGFKNDLVKEILPVITDIGATILDSSKDAKDSVTGFNVVGTILRWVAQAAAGGFAAFELLGKGIGGVAALIAAIPEGWDQVKATWGVVTEDLDATAQKFGGIIEGFGKAGTEAGKASEQVEALAKVLGDMPTGGGKAGDQGAGAAAAAAAAAQRKQLEQAFAATQIGYQRQIALFQTSADAQAKATELQKLNFELTEGKLKDLADPQKERLRLLAQELDKLGLLKTANEDAAKATETYKKLVAELNKEDGLGLDQAKERKKILDAGAAAGAANDDDYSANALKAVRAIGSSNRGDYKGPDALYGGASGEFGKIDKAVETENEAYAAQLKALDEYRQSRSDLSAKWDADEVALAADHQKALQALDDARWQVQITAAQQALGSVTDTMKTAFGEQSAAYKAAFLVQKAAAIAQSIVAIQTGIAQAAAQPWPANLAAMASVAAATASIVSNIQAVGMAHDGIDAVPETGTWLLQKGERVTTAGTSAKLDATLERVNQNVSAGGAGASFTFAPQIYGNPDQGTLALIQKAAEDGARRGHQLAAADIASGTGPISRGMKNWTTKRRVG